MPSRFVTGEACTQMSRQIGEPLGGTASHIQVWFLLEYGLPWTANIRKENALPSDVNAWLAEHFYSLPNSRLQFIKQGRFRKAPHRLFVVVNNAARPRMYAFSLRSYSEITQLDLPALLADTAERLDYRTEAPQFLVCTNGRRDPCCAKHGLPIYRKMAALAPEATWQCSHVGGDRFAANVLCFPHGLYYGRVDAAGAEQIVQEYRAGLVTLEYLRGRSCNEPVVQAAERFLRERMGVRAMEALELIACVTAGENEWRVDFRSTGDGRLHSLSLLEQPIPCLRYKNCRAMEKTYTSRFLLQEQISDAS